MTPSILQACLNAYPADVLEEKLATLRLVYTTGERLAAETRAACVDLCPEIAVRNCYSTNEGGDTAMDAGDGAAALTILPDVHAEVLDPNGRPQPLGAVGRLHVKGPALFKGYWTDAGVQAPDALYRTGDLVRWRAPDEIEFCGREAGSHVKVRGFKVFPELVERQVAGHPGIDAAFVAAVGDGDGDARLEAAVVLNDASLDATALRAWLAPRLPPHMVPVVIRTVASDAAATWRHAGKRPPNRALAARLAALPELRGGAVDLPEALRPLASCWADALKLPGEGADGRFAASSNFFDFGGSLAFVALAAALKKNLGVDAPVASLVASPTLEAMAAKLAGCGEEDTCDEVSVARSSQPRATGDHAIEAALD